MPKATKTATATATTVAPTPVEVVVAPAPTTPVETVAPATTTPVEESTTDNVENMFNKLVVQFQEAQNMMKTLQASIKVLHKEVIRERKENAKKTTVKKAKGTRKPSGIALPESISAELASFLGVAPETQISRIDVTAKVFEYVKSNNLQNPSSKKEIVPDAKLKALLDNGDKTVFFFNIQTFLKRHFPSKTATTPAAAVV